MTKKQAIDRLIQDNPRRAGFREFFEQTVDKFVGDSNVLDNALFEKIRTYINHLT